MTPRPDDRAVKAIAAALEGAPNGRAICVSLMRLAGQALARFASHDEAAHVHAQLARRHAERAARCWRP